MKISRGHLRDIISEVLLIEQNESDDLLAAVLASEAPNNIKEMQAIYDVIQTRANYKFKDLSKGDISAQIVAPGQFSGYNKFKNDPAGFIEYYSGTAPDSAYNVNKERVATEKLIRKRQFKNAHEAIKLGAEGFGATHFVNPAAASTGNRWWEGIKFKEAGSIGEHLFGWDTTVSQSLEAYNKRKK